MSDAFQLTVDKDNIAHLVFDLKGEKVNKFSMPVILDLEKQIDSIAKNKEIKALVISSGKDDVFVAGADLHSFEPMFKDPSLVAPMIDAGHRVFRKLENLPFPSFALIHGACLGGGMEFALACTYRVVSDHPKTLLGLPEVTLGIIPGWGGTQRLPRIVGLMEGLPMLLSGAPVKANKAWKIKLADAIYAPEFFKEQAQDFVKKALTPQGKKELQERRKLSGMKHALLDQNSLGRGFIYRNAQKDVLKKTKGHYPAPLILLDLVKETYPKSLDEGLTREANVFKSNLAGNFANAQNLIHLFFIQEALKKDTGVSTPVIPKAIKSAGVLGAGTMGGGIAWLFSSKDIPIRMKDIDWSAIGKGLGAAKDIYSKLVKIKKMKPNEVALKFNKISGTLDYSGFKNADIVVEAVVENLDLKHKILKELEGVIRPDAIIATNTSSLTLKEMGSVLQHPERFVGMHFFNPVNRMPLVEVVAGDKTSPEVVATAVDLCRKLGKTPIVVRDCPGFLVNRIFVSGANEILRMYEEGAEVNKLDKMMLDFGMPMAPFLLSDEVGNDVGYKVSKVFEHAYGDRMKMPKILPVMYEKQLFGKKSGKGFYIYQGSKTKFNPEVEEIRKGLGVPQKSIPDVDLRDRVFLLMINEAARCLDEKIVANPSYLDMALIMGTGFPPFKGGLLKYADTLGIDYIVRRLNEFKEKYGDRFAPCKYLLDMQKKGGTFF